jgi:hypothetical protein
MANLLPSQGDPGETLIPHDLAPRVAHVLGRERMRYLGMHVAPAPEVDEALQHTGTEARRPLSTRKEVLIILAVVVFVLVAVCIGYYA